MARHRQGTFFHAHSSLQECKQTLYAAASKLCKAYSCSATICNSAFANSCAVIAHIADHSNLVSLPWLAQQQQQHKQQR
jgi:hypothetical protein